VAADDPALPASKDAGKNLLALAGGAALTPRPEERRSQPQLLGSLP
jgi:hypothetical protein